MQLKNKLDKIEENMEYGDKVKLVRNWVLKPPFKITETNFLRIYKSLSSSEKNQFRIDYNQVICDLILMICEQRDDWEKQYFESMLMTSEVITMDLMFICELYQHVPISEKERVKAISEYSEIMKKFDEIAEKGKERLKEVTCRIEETKSTNKAREINK